MGTQNLPLDPMERELAAAQLDHIAIAFDGAPMSCWKDAVLRWHLQALADARSEAWIPGLVAANDPIVEEALGRFYRHHMRATIGRLKAENMDLRRKLLDAVACARFYASGAVDAGTRAHRMLARLDPVPALVIDAEKTRRPPH
jgi:hypothetical protein